MSVLSGRRKKKYPHLDKNLGQLSANEDNSLILFKQKICFRPIKTISFVKMY